MGTATVDSSRFWERGIVIALLVFPFLLSAIASALLFQDAPLEARLAREYRLETIFGQIETGRDANDFFSALFRSLEQRVYDHADPLQEWKRRLSGLKRSFPGMIEGILLDANGQAIPDLSDRKPPKQLVQRFFSGYSHLLSERRPLSSVEQSFIKSFLGPAVSSEGQLHGRLMLGKPLPDQHFVYLSQPRRAGMFMIFFRPDRPLRQLALGYLSDEVNRTNADVRIRLVHAGESSRRVLTSLGLNRTRRREEGIPGGFWGELQKSPRGHRWYRNTLIGRRIVAPSWWVIGTTSVSPEEGRTWSGLRYSLAWIVPLLVLLIWLEPAAIFRIHPLFGSIRVKLSIAVLYTTVVPLVVMGITAHSFLRNRESVLRTKIHEKLETTLAEIDSSFNRYIDSLCFKLSRFDRTPDPLGRMTLERFRKEYDAIRKALDLDSTQVFDASGTVVFEYISNEFPVMVNSQSKMFGKATRDVLKTMNNPYQALAQQAEAKEDRREFSIFSNLNLSNTSLTSIQAGATSMFLSPLLLIDHDRITHVILNLWEKKKVKSTYIQRMLPSFAGTYRAWHLLAWENGTPDRLIPADSRFAAPTRRLRRLVSSPSRAFRHMIRTSSQNWLLSGIRGKTLDGHSFLAIASDQPVREELDSLSWSLRFAVLLITGASMILGGFLARFFLQPMQQLTLGMEAIMSGNFRYRLPETSGDELGLLGHHFNQAITNLRDLEVARTLQEKLFPENPVVSGSWGVFGNCVTASQVGGDYVDYSLLVTGELRFILGDVSGHGVGSSLVVAMAKAIMEHPDTPSEPAEILNQINASFHAILKRKKMMSAVVGFIDPTTGILRMTNAGQCYPILLRDRTASFIEMKGFPLGTTKMWKPASTTLQLQPGDAVVFYSDGLYESADGSGEPIGFDRLLTALPALFRNHPRATVEAIREWHGALSPLHPPADDITILVLQSIPYSAGTEARG